LLTVFLGIKCNSINTNFREHGFEIVKKWYQTSRKFTEITGRILRNERNWKTTQTIIIALFAEIQPCSCRKNWCWSQAIVFLSLSQFQLRASDTV
jgi:hypothetical protein